MAPNTDTSSDYRQKSEQLDKIARAASNIYNQRPSPRLGLSLGCGIAVGVGAMLAFPNNFTAVLLAAAATGVICFAVAPLSKSWPDTLDALLIEYKPVNVEAYQRLSDRCAAVKGIDIDAVFEWLSVERDIVGRTVVTRQPNDQFPRFARQRTDNEAKGPRD